MTMGSVFQNHALVAALVAMSLAQILKPFIHYLTYHEWDPVQMVSSGGMPSSHSAFVCSLALVITARVPPAASQAASASSHIREVLYNAYVCPL